MQRERIFPKKKREKKEHNINFQHFSAGASARHGGAYARRHNLFDMQEELEEKSRVIGLN